MNHFYPLSIFDNIFITQGGTKLVSLFYMVMWGISAIWCTGASCLGWGAAEKQGGVRVSQIWTVAIDQRLMQLRTSYSQKKTAEILSKEFGYKYTRNAVRHRENQLVGLPKNIEYKETTEILADGSHKSDKLVRMSAEQAKDVDYLLRAHGFDKNAWELVSARNNIWNTYSKQDGVQTLYSSKITVKPKEVGLDFNKLLELIEKKPPTHVKKIEFPRGERYLTIPLFDLHFGINDCNHYKETQAKVLNLLDNQYKETLIIIGSDLFHHNDHRNRTASGREIEHADMTVAWEEAENFYTPIIYKALETCNKVSVMFIKGNHSETLEWAFVKMIKKAFPQLNVDDSFKERKAHIMGNIMIGSTHGDKANLNKIAELFSTEFPLLWAQAKTREVLCGDKHHEEVKDKGGIVVRQLSTRNKIDRYHDDNGYTMAHKRFQVFEYSRDELENIHYV